LAPAPSADARERLIARFGPAVVEPWWAALPALLEDLAARWKLTIDAPVGHGGTSFTLWCRRGSDRAVLKLTPEIAIAEAEAQALRAWAPTGHVPAVWEAEGGALLLEAVEGGEPTSIDGAAELMRALHATDPVPGAVPLAERVEFIFGRRAWPGDAALARHLAADDAPRRLLHGDLHVRNVIASARGLVVIDPRPCIGDPAFDAVDWLFVGTDDPREWAARCATLGPDPERIRAWCAAFYPDRSRAMSTSST
jgi:streptomycin 6-kinase